MNLVEGQKMVDEVEKAGVPNTVWYNYRRVPAVTLAKNLIDQGQLGRIYHYRELPSGLDDLRQSSPGRCRTLAVDVAAAGSGVTGDLLAHCIDTALWLNGPINSVSAMTETFVKERRHNLTGKVEPVGIDDACAFLCRFDNGSLGLFESTRYARAQGLYTFEVNGEKASFKWDLHDLHRLEYVDHRDDSLVRGWRSVHVTDGDMPYMKHWWVPVSRSATSTPSSTRWLTSWIISPRASPPGQPSATPWPPRPSAMPSSTRPTTASGRRWCRCDGFRNQGPVQMVKIKGASTKESHRSGPTNWRTRCRS